MKRLLSCEADIETMNMALITYFKASLRCPRCEAVGTASIDSHLGDCGKTYQIGDCPGADIHPSEFESTSYVVRQPSSEEPVRVLLAWTCEHCDATTFAEVTFADGCVGDIQAIDLTPDTLGRLHYIAEEVQSMLEEIMDGSMYDEQGVRADWLEILRAALERGRRWVPS